MSDGFQYVIADHVRFPLSKFVRELYHNSDSSGVPDSKTPKVQHSETRKVSSFQMVEVAKEKRNAKK